MQEQAAQDPAQPSPNRSADEVGVTPGCGGYLALCFVSERLNLRTIREGCLAFPAWCPKAECPNQTGRAAQLRICHGMPRRSGQHQDPLLGSLPEVAALSHEEFGPGEALFHARGRSGVDHILPQSGQQVANSIVGSPLGTRLCVVINNNPIGGVGTRRGMPRPFRNGAEVLGSRPPILRGRALRNQTHGSVHREAHA